MNNQLFIGRGVPYELMHRTQPDNYLDFASNAHNDKKVITARQQIRSFNAALKNPAFNCYVISGQYHDSLAKFAALELFANSFTTKAQPYWHMVNGSYRDPLRDDPEFRERVERISCLVLSNITINSGTAKFEKVRDLYELFSHIPRILVLTGDDPFVFCQTKLFIEVRNRVLYFN